MAALCHRHIGRSIDGDEDLAHFLGQAARTLRPNALAVGIDELTRAMNRTLDRFESLSRPGGPIAGRFAEEFGVHVTTPADVHHEVVRYIHRELTELHARLGELPDQGATQRRPPDARSGHQDRS